MIYTIRIFGCATATPWRQVFCMMKQVQRYDPGSHDENFLNEFFLMQQRLGQVQHGPSCGSTQFFAVSDSQQINQSNCWGIWM